MKKSLSLFSLAFVVFYGLVLVVRQLPGLVHGRVPFAEGDHSPAEWVQFAGDVLIYYLLALGTYCVLYECHPKKHYLSLLSGVLFICVASYFCALFWTRIFEEAPVRMSRYFQLVIIPMGVQVLFAALFYLIRYAQYKELQQLELQLQSRQTELAFLRSQINPHFLFNHLNNIYALVYEQNEQALPAIAGLSELLRYMLYNSSGKVPLTTEISYIEKYIALQQIRFEHPSLIEITKNGMEEAREIPALLFLPFIENAFKHGQVSSQECWLKIKISNEDNALHFSCTNRMKTMGKHTTGGIGLHNVKQQLNLLYPGLYRLEIAESENLFVVKLQLQDGK